MPVYIEGMETTISPDTHQAQHRLRIAAAAEEATEALLATKQAACRAGELDKDDLKYYIYAARHAREACHAAHETLVAVGMAERYDGELVAFDNIHGIEAYHFVMADGGE